MTSSMQMRAHVPSFATRSFAVLLSAASLLTLGASLLGCPSNEGSRPDAQTSSSSGATGTGPLANLESAPFMNEAWIANEGGQQMPFLFWGPQNVRLSAPCRRPNGQLDCDAIRQMRSGMPVEIPRRSLTGNISAGSRVCMKLGHRIVSGHNSVGAEDGFCAFPDGSMVSTGALEQYAMRVIE